MVAGEYIHERTQKALILAHRYDVSDQLKSRARSALYVYLAAIEQFEMQKVLDDLTDNTISNTNTNTNNNDNDNKSVVSNATEITAKKSEKGCPRAASEGYSDAS